MGGSQESQSGAWW